eukprot:CAMPEP_0183786324 /NCGR_PEP_ID=MMETSP0739-20130205/66965_1 /TAXON_ID=385413 /ORGANISM="Thalassiosira miniscula, Strain CCMP1093" /LENGTH=365 /DNA_ID=CAMNT_0026030365 /DNA_START=111 /DNA_END=1209 /DNA_ORIENTATION=+
MPATVYLVTGGARSGKSSYAQNLCETSCENPIYLATSKVWDDDFKDRVKRHQNERGDHWTTIEEPLYPSNHKDAFGGKAILVDCLTLWLTNFFMEMGAFNEPDGDKDAKASNDDEKLSTASEQALSKVKAEFDKMITQWNATFIFVTNEIGSGLHAETAASRKFVDAQGWLNQHVSSKADMVIHMVAGVPNIIKSFPAERRNPLKAPSSQDLVEREMLDKFLSARGLTMDDKGYFMENLTIALVEREMLDKFLSARGLTMDDKGYFMVKLDHSKGVIRVTYHSCIKNDKGEICDVHGNKISCCSGKSPDPMETFEARTAKEMTVKIFERWEHAKELVTVGHAAYIGREVQKAEQCLFAGKFYQQD